MVGKGVLLECLENQEIEKILLINRKPIDLDHPKIDELLVNNYYQLNEFKNEFIGYDACFHSMGTSSIRKTEELFNEITFELTKILVDICYEANPNMVFNYVSGTGTDSSEKGKTMWARVKGKTENYILNKGFKDAYMFRPGAILPEKGIRSSTWWYQIIYDIMRPFYFLMKRSDNVTSTSRIGKAMINTLTKSNSLKHLENKDINKISA